MPGYLIMNLLWSALHFLIFTFIISHVHSHALAKVKEHREDEALKMEPAKAVVFAGANASFICSHSKNVTILWDFIPKIRSYEVVHGARLSNATLRPIYFSKLTIFGTSRLMSGDVSCSTSDGNLTATGFLLVSGVQMGGACHNSTDCITDQAICLEGICQCPTHYVQLRLLESGYDVCREMIYRLYDRCEFNEQCAHLVDPKSICQSVCVCASYAKDRKGRCVSLNDISHHRSQEMYRVGLIAVTCIIILIVAMSLWVTLKRSCHEQSSSGLNGIAQTDVSYPEGLMIEIIPDKPPSYDDVIVSRDEVTAPPNIKEALKSGMTAKKLLRQVSAPAGQLLPQQGISTKPGFNCKIPPES